MSMFKDQINQENLPKHVAVIMDGNGRWAKGKGMQRVFGHRNALTAIRETADTASELGVKFLTMYAFSTENWNRPKLEVDALMSLLINTLKKELPEFQRKDVKINSIGDTNSLPKTAQKVLHLNNYQN